MTKELQKEIEAIMKSQSMTCLPNKFIKNANWYSLSMCQKLSEEFIIEFQDHVNWYEIFRHQKLSTEFVKGFMDKADPEFLTLNKHLL